MSWAASFRASGAPKTMSSSCAEFGRRRVMRTAQGVTAERLQTAHPPIDQCIGDGHADRQCYQYANADGDGHRKRDRKRNGQRHADGNAHAHAYAWEFCAPHRRRL